MKTFLASLVLCSALAFGQGGVIGGNGKIVGNGVVGATPTVTPSVVQSGTCVISGSTCTLTWSAVAAGDYLVCMTNDTGSSAGSCTATGETFNHQAGCSNATGYEFDCFVATNAAGGETSITCNTTINDGSCAFAEVTSPSSGHAIDVTGNAHSGTTAQTVSTSLSTTNANDGCIAFAASGNGSPGFSALSWTSIISGAGGVISAGSWMVEFTVPGSTGTQTATSTGPTGATNIPSGVVCLKP
jgi:hypothetical protein